MATYGDFPGVTVTTGGSAMPTGPKEVLYIHIESADPEMLPLKLAIEEDWDVYIYGPDERAQEIEQLTADLQEGFFFAQGIVTP